MSEMVERAIEAVFKELGVPDGYDWRRDGDTAWTEPGDSQLQNLDVRAVVWAVILAMREPTLNMSLSGMAQITDEMKTGIPPEMFDRAYSRAIDAALSDNSGTARDL